MNMVASLDEAMNWSRKVMGEVTPNRYADGTPCTEWDVCTLANHLVGGTWMFAGALTGQPLPTEAPSDIIGEDAASAYDGATTALRSAAGQQGALDRLVDLPIGQVPGQVAVGLALVDTLVHGWDLARATGQDASLPEVPAAMALAFSEQALSDDMRGSGKPFQWAIDPSATASPGDRLVAFLGRQP